MEEMKIFELDWNKPKHKQEKKKGKNVSGKLKCRKFVDFHEQPISIYFIIFLISMGVGGFDLGHLSTLWREVSLD